MSEPRRQSGMAPHAHEKPSLKSINPQVQTTNKKTTKVELGAEITLNDSKRNKTQNLKLASPNPSQIHQAIKGSKLTASWYL